MISHITLKFGRFPGQTSAPIPLNPITVFVGPNNSGKSKALAEIYRYSTSGQKNIQDVIVENLEFLGVPDAVAKEFLAKVTIVPNPNEVIQPGHVLIGTSGGRRLVPTNELERAMSVLSHNLEAFCQWYLSCETLMLDGPNRIHLVEQQPGGDLHQSPQTTLQVLFRDDHRRAEVRRIVYDAIGSYFVVDPTNLGQLRIRLSPTKPDTPLTERGIHDEAVRFHSAALSIEQSSDGIKAFTGIITTVIAGDPQIILIDEPEAFLHPSLAFSLGREIARATQGSEKRLFVATHSPNFVMGCIQSGAPVNIVRLTYRSGVATARILPSAEISKLMRNPLLRSTGLLSGLFYECVVITESDADRAFYQEVNERLLRHKSEWGIPNCLFLNAQNKQTVQTLVRPLRELGIPAAGIVDIDVIKDGGKVWADLLGSAFVPPLVLQSLANLRSLLHNACLKSGKDMKRDGGTMILSGQDKEAAENLLAQLSEYGIFVVPGGELESWLKTLGVSGHGPPWLIATFEKMGEDPVSPGYVFPADDDVWRFMGQLRGWMLNPLRKGIPE